MSALNTKAPAPSRDNRYPQTHRASNYSRYFEAGRDAAVIGENDAQAAHGLVPKTPEERQAWDAGRASIGLNTLM